RVGGLNCLPVSMINHPPMESFVVQTAQSLLDEALRLPIADRGEVAAKLLESLDDGADADGESAWGEEIRQRIEDVRSGQSQTVAWVDARAMIQSDVDVDADLIEAQCGFD
ncbi:MAG: addiction module protein, partial [Sphingobium sp.]